VNAQNRHDHLEETQPYVARQSTQQPSFQQFDIETPPRRRSGCGCFMIGCLGTLLLMTLIAGVGVWGAYRFYQNQLEQFTSDAPVVLPGVDVSQEQVDATVQKLEDFEQQFEDGLSPQELIITVEEINALIARNPELRGRVAVTIDDGNLRADVSVPLDELPGGKGRFFNGSLTMHVELEEGVLIAYLVDAQANGRAVPEFLMSTLRKENLAKDLYRDVEIARTLQRCEKLIVESDRIILRVRQKHADSAQPSESSDTSQSPDASDSANDPPLDQIEGQSDRANQEPAEPSEPVQGEVSEEFNTSQLPASQQ